MPRAFRFAADTGAFGPPLQPPALDLSNMAAANTA
jgi:hypothetical protein